MAHLELVSWKELDFLLVEVEWLHGHNSLLGSRPTTRNQLYSIYSDICVTGIRDFA